MGKTYSNKKNKFRKIAKCHCPICTHKYKNPKLKAHRKTENDKMLKFDYLALA